MDFAPVLPINLYPMLDRGNYHVVQSHLVEHASPETITWFVERGSSNNDHLVVLDNGTIELAHPDVDGLMDSVSTLQPDVVVIPDVLMDTGRTMELLSSWLDRIDEIMEYCHGVMIVPQGDTITGWCRCAAEMMEEMARVSAPFCIGIPKMLNSLTNMYYPGRYMVLSWLRDFSPMALPSVHLLGIYEGMEYERRLLKDFPMLSGMDSTLPYAQALAGEYTNESQHKRYIVGDQWTVDADDVTEDTLWMARVNISIARQLLQSFVEENAGHAVLETLIRYQERDRHQTEH